MGNYLRSMIERRNKGEFCGIPSYCTANPIVLEACIELSKRNNEVVLIEATANQVNQFGGYTGMRPADFRDLVYKIAENVGFDRKKIILGGDHLGPLTWCGYPEKEAMSKAEELVYEYVEAGFKKIHLDTSMKLADDPVDEVLSDSIIARRSARLCFACEKAYAKLLEHNPEEQRPVYIIGSEVPIPGGAQQGESSIAITKAASLSSTLKAYEGAFLSLGLGDAFNNIVGIVVQPGVEFGNDSFFIYDSSAASSLTAESRKHKSLVLEGHSTDYQPAEALRAMVIDGIAILKVGPALTFALREGLFALSFMENELLPYERQAHFPQVLEKAMLRNPGRWIKYYHGSDLEQKLSRKYSYSDRCRYYLAEPEVKEAISQLLDNMCSIKIPLSMLHQYMPVQYSKVIRGLLSADAYSLLKDFIVNAAEPYNYASIPEYDIAEVHLR